MRYSSLLLPSSLVAWVSAAPTVYLAGDSTMAPLGGKGGTEGWGQYLHYSLSVPVQNRAIAGRSARSYTREGRFDSLTDLVVSGDWVVIEFGHNDGQSSPDNGRSDCPGSGDEVCTVVYNGVKETTYTFPKYLEWAANNITAKGGNVIIASQTPNNPYETGTFVQSAPRFVALAKLAASNAGVHYIDHNAYVNAAYKPLGAATVDSFFPNDHTHTAPKGADLVSQAFVRGLACSDFGLNKYVVNGTSTIEGKCL